MMWVLMCVIALFIGFMFYSRIEDQLPEILHLPKSGDSGSQVATEPIEQTSVDSLAVGSSDAWQVRGDGKNVELIRDFQGRLEVGGQRYDPPTLALTCYEGTVYARVNMRMAAAVLGTKATVGTPTGAQQWSQGQGHDIYSPTPKTILAAVRAEKPFNLVLPYQEIGAQTVTFNPRGGVKALSVFPVACR
jgi:hypothetical protein